MKLKIDKKLKAASLNSKFTSSYKKKGVLSVVLKNIFCYYVSCKNTRWSLKNVCVTIKENLAREVFVIIIWNLLQLEWQNGRLQANEVKFASFSIFSRSFQCKLIFIKCKSFLNWI